MAMQLRKNNLKQLQSNEFDVLILGGGINGAVCASALTSQGAKVALIDKRDFAGYTSQHSSNLVWGGIKYMEGYEFGLVRKLCKSRNQLMRSYPSIVNEIRFYTTLEEGFRHSREVLYSGAMAYWGMGNGFTKPPRMLSKETIAREEPIIDLEGKVGGFEYSDAYLVDNDARFVFRFIREALNHGGICANYVESLGSERAPSGLWHTRVRCELSGDEFTLKSKVLLNACGPFVDTHNEKTREATDHQHVFSKGIHLIVRQLTDQRRVLTFFADDGRLFFVIPMGNRSCIGTTDTRQNRLPAVMTDEDRQFVLDNINKRLKLPKPLTQEDVIAERCGVRPLVIKRGKTAGANVDWTSLSRKHIIETNKDTQHISIFGGKLTDCINVGEEISREVVKLGLQLPYRGFRWYGEAPPATRDEFFHQAKLMGLDAMTSPQSSERLSTRLWRRYGMRALELLDDIRENPAMAEVLIVGTEYIRCEIHHAARHEMITKLDDFLRRRSKIALVVRNDTIRTAPGMQEACEILFGDQAQAKFDEYFQEGGGADAE